MIITTKTTVSFHPITEADAMRKFEQENPGWEKTESTIAFVFSKLETVYVEGRKEL